MSKILVQDAMIKNLIPNPAAIPNFTVISGYLGESDAKGRFRVYSPDLKGYKEFRQEEVLHVEAQAMGGSTVFLQENALVLNVKVQEGERSGSFLNGPITSGNALRMDDAIPLFEDDGPTSAAASHCAGYCKSTVKHTTTACRALTAWSTGCSKVIVPVPTIN